MSFHSACLPGHSQGMAIRICAICALGTLSIGLSGCGSSDSSSSSSTPTPLTDPCDADWKANLLNGTPPANHHSAPSDADHAALLRDLDISSVVDDLKARLTDSHPCWPADFGNYGPFFVRLAWHCSGSFRESDGKGGCGGGRQRFEPERSWDDNANLDKARALLNPIKQKYGDALSWGDLMIAAGTVALREMGTPIEQLCFGRIDEVDGTSSLELGPTAQQQASHPCEVNGACGDDTGLGATTIGLIYVNPEGPVHEEGGLPDTEPANSVEGIRSTFERMGHSDRATVALIGGGHAFGKSHGACPTGPGHSPAETFEANSEGSPWMGECSQAGGGVGNGLNTFTAGFEGQWTSTPLVWTNQFFKDLLNYQWEVWDGPGGHKQWRISGNESVPSLMRLTSDMALLEDDEYKILVELYASDMTAFDTDFNDAWFQLTTTHGSRWSEARKCDSGDIPSRAQMLETDIVV